jgi:predicted RNase H-like nuclease
MAKKQHLPYVPIASVVPCPAGWLVFPARLTAVTVVADDPIVLDTFPEVIDYRPEFAAIALFAPTGHLDDTSTGQIRTCDREARASVGWLAAGAIPVAPSRAALNAVSFEQAKALQPSLTRLEHRHFARWREVTAEIQGFHQRRIFSCHPEMSFFMLNNDEPLTTFRHTAEGMRERLALANQRVGGVAEKIKHTELAGVGHRHLVDAAGMIWTARRIAGKVITRLPETGEWDTEGVRMELVR